MPVVITRIRIVRLRYFVSNDVVVEDVFPVERERRPIPLPLLELLVFLFSVLLSEEPLRKKPLLPLRLAVFS